MSERFLPDKALDLIDEAASRLRLEMDALPAEIDEEGRHRQLEVGPRRWRGRPPRSSRTAGPIETEMGELEGQLDTQLAAWKVERDTIANPSGQRGHR